MNSARVGAIMRIIGALPTLPQHSQLAGRRMTTTRSRSCDPRGVEHDRDSDVIVVGAGLAGLAATAELADAGYRVLLVDQEPESSIGGQAFWSLGGLFFVA